MKGRVLIIAGSLVGASGVILTVIMCKAMNRSLTNVLFGTLGPTGDTPDADARELDHLAGLDLVLQRGGEDEQEGHHEHDHRDDEDADLAPDPAQGPHRSTS